MKNFIKSTLIATSLLTTNVSADCKSIKVLESGKEIVGIICGKNSEYIKNILQKGCEEGYTFIKKQGEIKGSIYYSSKDGTYSFFGKNGAKACFSSSAETTNSK